MKVLRQNFKSFFLDFSRNCFDERRQISFLSLSKNVWFYDVFRGNRSKLVHLRSVNITLDTKIGDPSSTLWAHFGYYLTLIIQFDS